LGLAAANAWWQQIDGSARLRWERVENDRFERARNLFFQYRDKNLSFTDCTSFAIMRELRLTTVISTDGHFRQVGLRSYPRLDREVASRGDFDRFTRRTFLPALVGRHRAWTISTLEASSAGRPLIAMSRSSRGSRAL
jgi:hypothetical protein